MAMQHLIIISLLFLTACDLELYNSDLTGSGQYVINAEVSVRSNTDFPIASALVKMEWMINQYYISNQDSGYTNFDGIVDLQPYIESLYLSNEIPEISFYISSSGFESDTVIINANSFTSNMLDTLTNQYIQNINHTIYLVPEN